MLTRQTWFTSDTHFGHKNIIELAKRPFKTVEEMDQKLIENWNSVVGKNDTVYHLGDFCWGDNFEFYLKQLNGTIFWLFGNHDPAKMKNLLLEKKQGDNYLEKTVNGNTVIMSHYAFRVWNKAKYGAINLFGHSHGSLPCNDRQVDVGVDYPAWDYTPVNIDDIKQHLKTLPMRLPEDHHGSIKDIEKAFALMEKQVGYVQAQQALHQIVPGALPSNLHRIPDADIVRVAEYINAARVMQKVTFQVILKDE